jgi:large subunit ribosomal protein L17
MRHKVDRRKLGRTTSHRKAMLANMTSSLILHDSIETTLPKAKELRRVADKIVTLSKRGTLHARRQAIALIRDKKAVELAFSTLSERFAKHQGGYTRIYKLGNRHGDNAPMAVIEYLSETVLKKEEATESKTTAKTKAKTKTKTKAKAKTTKTTAKKTDK